MRTLYTYLEKCDKEMEIMKIKHSNHVTDMKSQHAKEIETMKANHDKEINFMQSKLSSLEEKMMIMEFNHSNQVTAMEASYQEEIILIQNKLSTMDEEMTIMRFDYNNQLATMQANHKKEINYMQNCFMGMKAKNDKIIKDMEVCQISLQNRLLAIEEKQVPRVINTDGIHIIENILKIMEVNHSNKMSIIQNQIKAMQANHVTLQERFVKTELNQAKLIVRHAREMGSLHKRLEERKSQVSSCCEYPEKEANSINQDLTKNDMIEEEIKKGQVITHDTCATDPSSLTEQMQNEGRHVMHILHTSSKSFEAECSTSSVI